MKSPQPEEAPLVKHLQELRWRIFFILLTVLVLFLIALFFYDTIILFIAAPLMQALDESSSLAVLKITEAFINKMTISLLVAVIAASPIIFFHFWRFVAPGLYKGERRVLFLFVFFSSFLFFSGAALCYFLMPLAFQFLLQQIPSFAEATFSIGLYSSFVIRFVLVFGLVFELPIILSFLMKLGVLQLTTLKKYRPYFYVGFAIFAALLTPPDVVTQVALILPMVLLYESSIFVYSLRLRKTDGRERSTE